MQKISFKRITSTGNFIPEIDGLRFVAIVSVVLYHINGYLSLKDRNPYIDNLDFSFLTSIIKHGHFGVELFFVISGIILGIPFAKQYILNQKPVNLKKYFLRRVTRLEPPYIIIMTVLLILSVYVTNIITLDKGVQSYLCSIFYSHNLIYGKKILPLLNNVAWSLEIEIQFYLLAPIFALLLSFRSPIKRRLSLLSIFIVFLIFRESVNIPFKSIINYVEYFLLGIFFADLYVTNTRFFAKKKYDFLIGLVFFIGIWFFDCDDYKFPYQKIMVELFELVCIFFVYYYVLFHKVFKLLSTRLITNIGGMCYTIYLIHNPVISMTGDPLIKCYFSQYSYINVSIYILFMIMSLTFFSSIVFLFLERPCMDKDWYKKVFKIKEQIPIQEREQKEVA